MSDEIAKIQQTEFSQRFVRLMKDAMTVSFYKYGKLEDAYPHKVDAIGSLAERLNLYVSTGNTEYLVDVANFAMIEFMHPRHPQAHFASDCTGRYRAALKQIASMTEREWIGEDYALPGERVGWRERPTAAARIAIAALRKPSDPA